jgi:hypothetical protein
VIALPLLDRQQRRSFLCGSELRINSLVSCLLEFIPSSNPRSYIFIYLHICVVACEIFGCRWFLHCTHKVWFIYFLQIQVFHNLLYFTFVFWLIRHKCQGDSDPPAHPINCARSSGPWSAAKFLQNFKVILFTPLGITGSFQLVSEPNPLI